jgi:hypothetical protein
MGMSRKNRFEQPPPRRIRKRRRDALATLNPWIFLGAAGLGATLYFVGRELLGRRRDEIEVEIDVDDAVEAGELDLDSPGPDVLDEAWMPGDGQEALPGRG